jgi:hypothetical protein
VGRTGCLGSDQAALEPGRAHHHLEAGSGEVPLLVGPAEQGVGRVQQVEGPGLGGGLDAGLAHQVGVIGGPGPQGEDLAGAHVEGHDRALTLTEGVAGDPLHVAAERQHHAARPVAVDEEVGQAPQLELGGLAGELLVVDPLDPGGAEVQREEARHLGEELALGVLALALQRGVDLDAAGHHHPVDGGDRAPGPAVVGQHLSGVVGVVAQRLGLEHLDAVELGEQGQVGHQDGHGETADLAVHPTPSRSRRRSCRVVTSSDTRMSRASST